MKSLSRDAIQRMVGGEIGSAGSGGSEGTSLAGYASQAWVEQNYISKDFFNALFTIHSTTSGTDVTPNATENIDSIEAKYGLWSDKYISALGQNSSGGGGGGATTLADLLDVSISSPANGQLLVYDSPLSQWKNISGGAGSGLNADLLDGQHGSYYATAASLSALQGSVTTLQGYFTSGIANNANNADKLDGQHGSYYATAASVTTLHSYFTSGIANNADKLDGYHAAGLFTNLSNSNNQISISIGGTTNTLTVAYATSAGSATTASKLSTVSKTAWGQTYWTSGGVPTSISGDMTGVGSITMSGNLVMDSGSLISSGGSNILQYDGTQTVLNYGYRTSKPAWVCGSSIEFRVGNSVIAQVIGGGLQIGDALLSWDSANNAIKVAKADGSAANLYTLGGVSALGMSAGGGGNVSNLTVENYLYLGDTDNYIYRYSSSSFTQLRIKGSSTVTINNNCTISADGNTLMIPKITPRS